LENSLIDVAQAESMFLSSEETSQDARKLQERDRDYYDNKQLTKAEIEELRKRGQPPIVINRIKRKVDFLAGMEKQQRSDPKAYPRTPQHEDAAHAATDALRYVADNTRLDRVRSNVWRNVLIEGMGGCQITVEGEGEEAEIEIHRTACDRMFYDPHSSETDFSDARFMGLVVWSDLSEAVHQYGKEFKAPLEAILGDIKHSDTYDDKPRWNLWGDKERKRVRIIQLWHETAQGWAFCEFAKGVVLKEGLSPYLDEEDQPEHPFVWVSAYVDRENNRYGAVREMIDAQDEINKRRSKALHLLTMRQAQFEKGAVDDPAETKRQLSKPDGMIETNPGGKFELLNTGDLAAGQASLLQEAKAEIDAMGPNPSMMGKGGGDQSGRAIMAQQQGGLVELGDLLNGLRDFDNECYRKIWRRIRQSWTGPRWIRVTDDEKNVQFAALNAPMQDEFGNVTMHNPVAEMDVDIIIEDAPDVTTLQGEQFESFMQLMPALANMPPQFMELAIEMAPNLRNKDKLLEIIKGLSGQGDPNDPQAQQAQAQQQQEQQAQAQHAMQMQMAQFQAAQEKTQSETMRNRAQAIKTSAEAAKVSAEAAEPPMPQQAAR
jgi:hypothetical protein